jgi:hypothetical protein
MVCAFTVTLIPRITTDADVLRDAWEKQKDLDSYEAKWLYVDALQKVWSASLMSWYLERC